MVTDEKPQISNCNIQFYFKSIEQTITFKLCFISQFFFLCDLWISIDESEIHTIQSPVQSGISLTLQSRSLRQFKQNVVDTAKTFPYKRYKTGRVSRDCEHFDEVAIAEEVQSRKLDSGVFENEAHHFQNILLQQWSEFDLIGTGWSRINFLIIWNITITEPSI